MLFSFEGRIKRLHFWLCSLGLGIVFDIILFGLAGIMGVTGEQYINGAIPVKFYVIIGIVYIPFLWAAFAINAKRCHDRDRSGWFQLIALIPLIGSIWLLVELGFLDGTQGPNRFGPSPKGIGGAPVSSVFS